MSTENNPSSLQRLVRLIYCTTLLFLGVASICHSLVIWRWQNRIVTLEKEVSLLRSQQSIRQSGSLYPRSEGAQLISSNLLGRLRVNQRDGKARDAGVPADASDLTKIAAPHPSFSAVALVGLDVSESPYSLNQPNCPVFQIPPRPMPRRESDKMELRNSEQGMR